MKPASLSGDAYDEIAARYARESGRILLTGTQALVRLPLMQRRRDAAAGIRSGGFICGYRGSPLGGYDKALWAEARTLREAGIHFEPGINEDLAATAVWGTQQVALDPRAKVAGVFAVWYGKGPGVDRSLDVLRHGNHAGTSRHGGVLLVCGDDHGCQSSTLPHQSEQTLMAAAIPVLNPATVGEYLEYGLLGIALSRYSGCWVGFKAVSEAVERTESVQLTRDLGVARLPTDFIAPPAGLSIRWPDPPLDQEARLLGPKMEAVSAFARANGLDRVALRAPQPRLGLVTSGKSHLDVLQALDELGLSHGAAADLGLSIYKVGLSWPLESSAALSFATGLEEVLVVEEKRSLIEEQLARLLYRLPASSRPRLVGKRDERGAPLLRESGELDPRSIARLIVARLDKMDALSEPLRQRVALLGGLSDGAGVMHVVPVRTPYFCSGCPHNTSTTVPEGSRAIAGIGCHSMALSIPARRTSTYTQMGGEGASWIGQAPFTAEKHVFQNMGDGTYFHSGLLAIRAAVAAGVNITYKILFNDAVAMTGGQPVEGKLTVDKVTRQLLAEGARRVVVVADDPRKYPEGTDFGAGVVVHGREQLNEVQMQLREIEGLTALVYDQTCAAESRRRRKRGLAVEPVQRVIINDAVCEGCGDCSSRSNCISILPLETRWGLKRQVDQSSCNKDYSCLAGFCPSFVTVRGKLRRQRSDAGGVGFLPQPAMQVTLDLPYAILVTGIGGTGVVTIGALLGMAAHLEGKGSSVLDFTGMAQKNGAVTSHVRIARTEAEISAARIPVARADLVLACDLVVAASPDVRSRMKAGVTRVIANSCVSPTAAFVRDGDAEAHTGAMMTAIRDQVGESAAEFVAASERVVASLGDSIYTNVFMIGYAYQKGLVPLALDSIERAIELNGVAVSDGKAALILGRRAALEEHAESAGDSSGEASPMDLAGIVSERVDFLTEYQDAAYAEEYRRFVAGVADAERRTIGSGSALAEAVAHALFTLMSYKDEYEVARLYASGSFLRQVQSQFEPGFSLRFHLAPPIFSRLDPATGAPRKREYGPWMLHAMRLLARLKWLRHTPVDPFGYSADRRLERRLIVEYGRSIAEICAGLAADNHALAVQIASLPLEVRGFGHVKERNLRVARAKEEPLLAAFRSSISTREAARVADHSELVEP